MEVNEPSSYDCNVRFYSMIQAMQGREDRLRVGRFYIVYTPQNEKNKIVRHCIKVNVYIVKVNLSEFTLNLGLDIKMGM